MDGSTPRTGPDRRLFDLGLLHDAASELSGLSTPQQMQMALLAPGARYKRLARRIVRRRLEAPYRGLDAPLPADPLRAGYYCKLDLMAWAERHYGREFMEFLARRHEPVDLLLRLAEQSSIVLMPGGGFAGPQWSARVSLANLPEEAYGKIGTALHAAARGYVEEWQAARGRRHAKRRAQ